MTEPSISDDELLNLWRTGKLIVKAGCERCGEYGEISGYWLAEDACGEIMCMSCRGDALDVKGVRE